MSAAAACLPFLVAGCVTLVAPYDATYDQSLNKLAEDTARFTALAEAGGPERLKDSKETIAYYAATYNLLDRLSLRASLARGSVACPTNASLKEVSRAGVLPDDYMSFDCREFQLYSVRSYVDLLNYGHNTDGVLNKGEAKALGVSLQNSIAGAIKTAIANKP